MKKNNSSKFIFIQNHLINILLFIVGASGMIIELVGSRILTPYFGGSINIWSVLIGVILGSLALGYWVGGKMADKFPNINHLSYILIITAIYLDGVVLFKDLIIFYIFEILSQGNIVISSIIASLSLFFIPNFLLGMITPYVIKLKLTSLNQSGEKVGFLYAISTIGSICGTFAAGFFLIPTFGVGKTLLFISFILIISALLLSLSKRVKIICIAAFILSVLVYVFIISYEKDLVRSGIIETNSSLERIFIYKTKNNSEKKEVIYLITGAYGSQSRQEALSYTKYIYDIDQIVNDYSQSFKSALIIGGGALTMSDYLLKKYPQLKVDVIELDPKIIKLAEMYFTHKITDREKVYIEDGRVYLNKNKTKYDVIINDAYIDIYPPYQLITIEAINKIHNSLNEDGVYVINLISSLNINKGGLVFPVVKTLNQIFSNVIVLPTSGINDKNKDRIQNLLVIAIKSKLPIYASSGFKWQKKDFENINILKDDLAPVENYLLPITLKRPDFPVSLMVLKQSVYIMQKKLQKLLMRTEVFKNYLRPHFS